jgi:GGDEF domain-containing protein
MPPFAPRRRRGRPVADAPIDALLLRTGDLAKGWLLALLEDAPLDRAPALADGGIVDEGPQLCDAVVRALGDDLALHRLEPGGSLAALAARVGELAGAGRDPAATARAVDTLGSVLWAALRRELPADDGELISDVAERLALVCAQLRVAALERRSAGDDIPGAAAPMPDAPAPMPDPPAPVTDAPAPVPDALDAAVAASATGPDRGPDPLPPPPPPLGPSPRPASTDVLWVGALEDAIVRSDGSPLSLLLVELDDAERVAATESAVAATAAFEHFSQAVRGAVRRQDILVSETDGRAWIIARDTGRFNAQALAARVAEAVGAGAAWRGAPLIASVGVAVLGEDGRTADELIDAAEEARFAAAASGTDVTR